MSTLASEPAAFISQDLSCVHCGYNLRGLTTDKLCPECGTPIARSIHGNLLRFADPAWLKKLKLGTNLKLWNIVIMIVLSACIGGWAGFAGGPAIGASFLLVLVGTGLGLAATFLITTQEPRIALEEDTVTLRKVIRFCAVTGAVAKILSDFPLVLPRTFAVVIGLKVLSLAGVVTVFGELLYYRRFARRVPNEKLARSTGVVLWGLPVSFSVAIVGAVVFWALSAPRGFAAGPAAPPAGATSPPAGTVAPSTSPVPAPPVAARPVPAQGVGFYTGISVVCLGSLSLAVFGIWYIVLLINYGAAFKRALFESGRRQAAGDEILTPPRGGGSSTQETP